MWSASVLCGLSAVLLWVRVSPMGCGMVPVLSGPMIEMDSVFAVIPSAERCLSPTCRGMSGFCDTGRMAAADSIRSFAMMSAPSCSGLFLKKIFSIRRVLMSASIISPDSLYSLRLALRAMTMSAPVFVLAMLRHAKTTFMLGKVRGCFLLFGLKTCCILE